MGVEGVSCCVCVATMSVIFPLTRAINHLFFYILFLTIATSISMSRTSYELFLLLDRNSHNVYGLTAPKRQPWPTQSFFNVGLIFFTSISVCLVTVGNIRTVKLRAVKG